MLERLQEFVLDRRQLGKSNQMSGDEEHFKGPDHKGVGWGVKWEDKSQRATEVPYTLSLLTENSLALLRGDYRL